VLRTHQGIANSAASDAEFQPLGMPFLPQQYKFQSGLVVNVRNMRKNEDVMALKLFLASAEQGDGYALHEFTSLQLLRRDFADGHWCMFEEVGSGNIVGCLVIHDSRRIRTSVASISESYLVLDKAFQVRDKPSSFFSHYVVIGKYSGLSAVQCYFSYEIHLSYSYS